jgi:hypothetical protein
MSIRADVTGAVTVADEPPAMLTRFNSADWPAEMIMRRTSSGSRPLGNLRWYTVRRWPPGVAPSASTGVAVSVGQGWGRSL